LNVRHLKLMGDLGQIVPLSFNVNDRDSITRSVARSNVVINLMGSRRETLNHSYNDVHALAAKRVAECARAAGAERLIHFSALGASEDSPSAFFRSKAAGEKAVLEAFPNATIVRPGPVFGPEDWLLQRMAGLIHHDSVVPFLEDNDQKMQPVWVNDVAAGVMNIILNDSTKGRIVEMAGPEVLTDVQIALRVHQVLQEENVIKRYSDSHYRYVFVYASPNCIPPLFPPFSHCVLCSVCSWRCVNSCRTGASGTRPTCTSSSRCR
jgi:NADH dehydrogenase (ubiquinone) 1 alpha subcomplex subunit 9